MHIKLRDAVVRNTERFYNTCVLHGCAFKLLLHCCITLYTDEEFLDDFQKCEEEREQEVLAQIEKLHISEDIKARLRRLVKLRTRRRLEHQRFRSAMHAWSREIFSKRKYIRREEEFGSVYNVDGWKPPWMRNGGSWILCYVPNPNALPPPST
ncbi:Aspartate--tRNA(Asp/Asn) ligase [Frankliniella fusca]|uniref:Aspartate--tRNA(Asp/Asn) ligase n=1 Tax=Frankliniella fusca TaxID=407009 RepID=A0AAE1H7M8_9NEOP|nr:Aspartate--tRNA(Asp/Asn) ligase [Frankliniella fusca]